MITFADPTEFDPTMYGWAEGGQAIDVAPRMTQVRGLRQNYTKDGKTLSLWWSSPYTITAAALDGKPLVLNLTALVQTCRR